ncbi:MULTISPECIES: oligosaccharide flippase family protein [Providencia]|uniref:oligosaccharide flippase family protein n=1 Tax=Providencia TaxID=586 RepID=UPI00234A5469|nr:oligosaccharide flippase family protein [Providencia sp. PROV020]
MHLPKVAKNTIIYIIGDIVTKSIPFLLLPIVTHYLTLEEYGQVSFYLTIIEILTIFVIMGGQNYYRYIFFSTENRNGIIFIPFFLSSIFFLIFQIPLFLYDVFIESIGSYVFLPTVAFGQSICALIICKFQMEENPIGVTTINISLAIVSFISTIILLLNGFGLEGRTISIIITPVLIGCILTIILLKKEHYSFTIIQNHFYNSLSFGAKSLMTSLSWWLRSGMDRVIIQQILGASILGLYAIAIQLSMVISVVSLAFNVSIMPKIFSLVREKKKKVLLKLILSSTLIIILFSTIFIILAPYLIGYILPPQYSNSVILLTPIVCGIVLHFIFLSLCNIVTAMGKPGTLSVITIAGSFIHILLSYTLAKNIGINGIIWSSTISYLISIILMILIFFNKTSIKVA